MLLFLLSHAADSKPAWLTDRLGIQREQGLPLSWCHSELRWNGSPQIPLLYLCRWVTYRKPSRTLLCLACPACPSYIFTQQKGHTRQDHRRVTLLLSLSHFPPVCVCVWLCMCVSRPCGATVNRRLFTAGRVYSCMWGCCSWIWLFIPNPLCYIVTQLVSWRNYFATFEQNWSVFKDDSCSLEVSLKQGSNPGYVWLLLCFTLGEVRKPLSSKDPFGFSEQDSDNILIRKPTKRSIPRELKSWLVRCSVFYWAARGDIHCSGMSGFTTDEPLLCRKIITVRYPWWEMAN